MLSPPAPPVTVDVPFTPTSVSTFSVSSPSSASAIAPAGRPVSRRLSLPFVGVSPAYSSCATAAPESAPMAPVSAAVVISARRQSAMARAPKPPAGAGGVSLPRARCRRCAFADLRERACWRRRVRRFMGTSSSVRFAKQVRKAVFAIPGFGKRAKVGVQG